MTEISPNTPPGIRELHVLRAALHLQRRKADYLRQQRSREVAKMTWVEVIRSHTEFMKKDASENFDGAYAFYALIADGQGYYDGDTIRMMIEGEREYKRQALIRNPEHQQAEKMPKMFKLLKKGYAGFRERFLQELAAEVPDITDQEHSSPSSGSLETIRANIIAAIKGPDEDTKGELFGYALQPGEKPEFSTFLDQAPPTPKKKALIR